MSARYLEGSRAALRTQNNRLYAEWERQLRVEQGLRTDQAVDHYMGVPLPREKQVTSGDNGYALMLESEDGAVAALPLDDWAQQQQGKAGIDVRGHKDESALDARLRDRERRKVGDGRVGGPRPR